MKLRFTSIVMFLSILSLVFGVAAGNIFGDLTTTAGGLHTWDSDLINIEQVDETGAGVYVAVLDTGMVPNWADYFPKDRLATELGIGFEQPITFKGKTNDPCGLQVEVGQLHQTTWVGSRGSTHGTHVASTILGYFYRSNFDAIGGFPIPPVVVRGIAPDVTVIPVKVLADYQIPAMMNCATPTPAFTDVFGTSEMVVAGIRYATDLAIAGYRPMVINMSLGGSALEDIEKEALDYAISNGVIVVAAAGNSGEGGMHYPGAYPPVISAGSAGWVREWLKPTAEPPYDLTDRYRMWWLKYDQPPMLPGSGEVADPTVVEDVYVSDFSSRELTELGQELDVLAPGSWVRGPFPGTPGYAHLPWYSNGIGDLVSNNPGNFYYVGGTSMATPHVASVAALLLEQDQTLTQAQVEAALKAGTLPIPAEGSRYILDNTVAATITWDTYCEPVEMVCDAVGAGLIQADLILNGAP